MATQSSASYVFLEGNVAKQLGVSGNISDSFFATSTFIYTLLFVAIVVAAFYRYTLAGIWRMEASSTGIKKSNDELKRVSLGLLGVFTLFLILFTVNKGMLTGDVGLGALGKNSGSYTGGTPNTRSGTTQNTTTNTATPSKSCSSPDSIKTIVNSNKNICDGASCSALSGCNYQQYLSIIKSESSKLGVDYKMIVVAMCKESTARKDLEHKNPDQTYDCGLMQINQREPCGTDILLPEKNIAVGVMRMKEKINLSSNSRIYANTPVEAGIFASYNCCSNGTVPNAESVSCNSSSGFNNSIPKWACPIDPGTGNSNMCAVKSYACEAYACLSQVQ